MRRSRSLLPLLVACVLVRPPHASARPDDPLPSRNDGPARQAIVEFVRTTGTQGSPALVPPAERIATFDQDGTLRVGQAIDAQVA